MDGVETGSGDPPDKGGSPNAINNETRTLVLYTADLKFDWYKLIIQSKRSVGTNASNGNYIGNLQLSRLISEVTNKSKDVNEIRRLNRNKFLVVCSTARCANLIIENARVQDMYNAFVPSVYMQRTAIVRDIDLDIDNDTFLENADAGTYKIINVQRLNRRSEADGKIAYVPSKTMKITFAGQDFPSYIVLWYTKVTCEPYKQNPIQCFNCYKFGHITKSCRSTKLCKICFQKEDGHTCNPTIVKCTNCDGTHNASSKSCPEFERQKSIKELMCTRNLCFPEAASLVPSIKSRYSVKTSNRYNTLNEDLNVNLENFPVMSSNSKVVKQHVPRYVPPALPKSAHNHNANTFKRKVTPPENFNDRSKQKKKPHVAPFYFTSQSMSSPGSYYSDKQLSAMFYKGCEVNKNDKDNLSDLCSQSQSQNLLYPSQTFLPNPSFQTFIKDSRLGSALNYASNNKLADMETDPKSPDLS
ncbi:hypothetical protein WDU94_005614 [Cyamophila willieti]